MQTASASAPALPLMARQMDKVALVNSMNSTQGAHEQGQYYTCTRATRCAAPSGHPAMGAWLQKFQERATPACPAAS